MVQDLLTESVEKRFGNTLYLPHAVEWLTDNGCCYIADSIRTFATSLQVHRVYDASAQSGEQWDG